MENTKPLAIAVAVLAIFGLGLMAYSGFWDIETSVNAPDTPFDDPANNLESNNVDELVKFSSDEEFRSYFERSDRPMYLGERVVFNAAVETLDTRQGGDSGGASRGQESGPSRQSSTNVQEQGIDEPDIVKIGNEGETIFYSSNRFYYTHEKRNRYTNTKVINAFPAEELSVTEEINASGELLLVNETLVVFSPERIHGYDVSDPGSPQKEWTVGLNSSVVSARLYDGNIYMVTKERVDRKDPCPLEPLRTPTSNVTVECTEVYHPKASVPVDVTYTAVVLNPGNGEVEDTVSFVGSARGSVVYMSENAIYATYTHVESAADIQMDFLLNNARDLLDDRALQRLEALRTYNISDRAKRVEIQVILEDWYGRMSDDERLRVRNELRNRFRNYSEEHKREFETTGIVEIGIGGETLSIADTGQVPGHPLNQFSLDEHNGTLRIATTVGDIRGFFGADGIKSENDVYVLGQGLDVSGSVKGMGVTERIYSVRFIGDKGYVVTFRRIDPFHVLDLSNPSNITLQGKLKLPGYSSYLHPLGNDRILGIGEQDSQVKAVVFNVSNPENPTIEDDYILDDSWSEISQTHHAFLMDPKHEVFFLPGSEGGYIFSYDDGLELKKTVDTERALRAVYIDDKMYILSTNEVVVIDEDSWERVKTLKFER